MPLIVPNPYADYPPRWGRLEQLYRAGYEPEHLGFRGVRADLNRFANRYRVAKCFRGIQLEGYSDTTIRGYNSLFQVFATWSASERFLPTVGLDQDACESLLESYDSAAMVVQVKAADESNAFYRSIQRHVKHKGRMQLRLYLQGEPFNAAYLGSTVRHVFAHGILTPHFHGCSPSVVNRVCTILHAFFMQVMDSEFAAKVSTADGWIRCGSLTSSLPSSRILRA